MNAYNCLKKSSKPDSFVTPSKYGVDHVKFCHDTTGAIHASTMINDSIRFLNIQSLRYLRYFDGHTKKVSGISISPIEDSFVSVSLDKTLKLWDFRVVDRCISFTLPDSVFVPPKVAIDPTGLVIAVCLNSQKLALYDIRKLEAGSFFNSASIEQNGLVMDMKFSTDNTKILYSTNGTSISIVDAHNGKLVHSLTGEFFFI